MVHAARVQRPRHGPAAGALPVERGEAELLPLAVAVAQTACESGGRLRDGLQPRAHLDLEFPAYETVFTLANPSSLTISGVGDATLLQPADIG